MIINVDKSARPCTLFQTTASPICLKGRIEEELERLQQDGIIEPVKFSEWAAPVVPVLKFDGSLRLCGVYYCIPSPDSMICMCTSTIF